MYTHMCVACRCARLFQAGHGRLSGAAHPPHLGLGLCGRAHGAAARVRQHGRAPVRDDGRVRADRDAGAHVWLRRMHSPSPRNLLAVFLWPVLLQSVRCALATHSTSCWQLVLWVQPTKARTSGNQSHPTRGNSSTLSRRRRAAQVGISCPSAECGRPADWPEEQPFFLPLNLTDPQTWLDVGLGVQQFRVANGGPPETTPEEAAFLEVRRPFVSALFDGCAMPACHVSNIVTRGTRV